MTDRTNTVTSDVTELLKPGPFRTHIPSGELEGDDSPIRDAGSKTGMVPNTDTGGMDLSINATNSLGSITSDTKSDPPGDSSPDDAPDADDKNW